MKPVNSLKKNFLDGSSNCHFSIDCLKLTWSISLSFCLSDDIWTWFLISCLVGYHERSNLFGLMLLSTKRFLTCSSSSSSISWILTIPCATRSEILSAIQGFIFYTTPKQEPVGWFECSISVGIFTLLIFISLAIFDLMSVKNFGFISLSI